jgi:hypothetical protein
MDVKEPSSCVLLKLSWIMQKLRDRRARRHENKSPNDKSAPLLSQTYKGNMTVGGQEDLRSWCPEQRIAQRHTDGKGAVRFY